MELVKYKVGQVLTYKKHNVAVTVVGTTLAPGGGNADVAIVIVETKNGILMPVPVSRQDEYLTTDPPLSTVAWLRLKVAGKL